jgi:transcriptional regulator with XRE-family HTH domain
MKLDFTCYRVARVLKGYTINKVSNDLGIPESTYQKIEAGNRIPRLPLMIKIAEYLELEDLASAARKCLNAREIIGYVDEHGDVIVEKRDK